jgi:hypothetical protein
MSKFTLRRLSATVFEVKLGRDKIGHVTQYGSRYTAIITHQTTHKRLEATSESVNVAFSNVVKSYNRISMCREDSLDKAREVLAERNEQARKQNEFWNDAFNSVARDLNMSRPLMTSRLRSRKVYI